VNGLNRPTTHTVRTNELMIDPSLSWFLPQADDPDHAPTGDAYKKHQMMMSKKRQQAKQAKEHGRAQEVAMIQAERENIKRNANKDDEDTDEDSDEYDELLEGLDHDPEISALRSKRMMVSLGFVLLRFFFV